MASETEEALGAVFARMGAVGHEVCDVLQVGIENDGTVEFGFNGRAVDCDFLVVPFADGMLVSLVRRNHSVSRAMHLAWIQF